MSTFIIGLFIYLFIYLKAHTKFKTWSAKVHWVLWLLIALPYYFNYVNYYLCCYFCVI